jgi:hypothetical protein
VSPRSREFLERATWNLFQRTFVDDGDFDGTLLAAARAVQGRREAIDYDAAVIDTTEASTAVAIAERFVHAVATMLDS